MCVCDDDNVSKYDAVFAYMYVARFDIQCWVDGIYQEFMSFLCNLSICEWKICVALCGWLNR